MLGGSEYRGGVPSANRAREMDELNIHCDKALHRKQFLAANRNETTINLSLLESKVWTVTERL